MSDERKKILEMLAQGKIDVDAAEKLLKALGDTGAYHADGSGTEKGPFKYLRVMVEPAPGNKDGERVNVRVPLKLIRAGLKLTALVPQDAHKKINEALHKKGIEMDLLQLTAKDLEELVANLNDLSVEVDGKETIRVFCE